MMSPAPPPHHAPRPWLARLADAVRGFHARHIATARIAVEVQDADGTWHQVLSGNLPDSQLPLILADQQRHHPGHPLRIRDQRSGEILARS